MHYDVIAFDLLQCERSSRFFRKESEILIRMADKLASAVTDTSYWWEGDSRYSFVHYANELDSQMRKAAGRILEMREVMIASANYKKAVDEHMKIEPLKPISIDIEDI